MILKCVICNDYQWRKCSFAFKLVSVCNEIRIAIKGGKNGLSSCFIFCNHLKLYLPLYFVFSTQRSFDNNLGATFVLSLAFCFFKDPPFSHRVTPITHYNMICISKTKKHCLLCQQNVV